jgi:hypothetical protein
MKAIAKTTLLALATLFGLSIARAQVPQLLFDGCHWTYPKLCDLWKQRKCWCPDDYCPKKAPCILPNVHGCVDDYCPKKLPCVPPNPRGCLDDYCPKTCPIQLGSNSVPWYTGCPAQPCKKAGCTKTNP